MDNSPTYLKGLSPVREGPMAEDGYGSPRADLLGGFLPVDPEGQVGQVGTRARNPWVRRMWSFPRPGPAMMPEMDAL